MRGRVRTARLSTVPNSFLAGGGEGVAHPVVYAPLLQVYLPPDIPSPPPGRDPGPGILTPHRRDLACNSPPPPPLNRLTGSRRLWRHYLPATTLVGGKNKKSARNGKVQENLYCKQTKSWRFINVNSSYAFLTLKLSHLNWRLAISSFRCTSVSCDLHLLFCYRGTMIRQKAPPIRKPRPPPEGLFCVYPHRPCMQNRLEGYEYCAKHILEDKNSVYKQCNYMSGKTGKRCPCAAPKSDKKEG